MRYARPLLIALLLAVSAALLLHTLFDPEGWTSRAKARDDLEAVREENDRLQHRATSLRQEIRALRQRREVQERVIRDELGFVGADEVIIEMGR